MNTFAVFCAVLLKCAYFLYSAVDYVMLLFVYYIDNYCRLSSAFHNPNVNIIVDIELVNRRR